MRALIISEGRSRAALAAVRALGRAGWQVHVASPERSDLAAASRWARRWLFVPRPEDDLDAFVAAAATASAASEAEVVFGCGDAEILALSGGRDLLGASVGYGPHRSVVRALDKLELDQAARRAGIATPRTAPATQEHLVTFPGPVVVKARLHWSPSSKGAPARQATLISGDPEEVTRRAEEIRAAGGEPIVQEMLHGKLLSVTTLVDAHGATPAEVHQVAQRVWPTPAGGSARARTVRADAELSARVRALLSELEWEGLAHVQFLVPDDGVPRLIDLNGRFYGSMALALAAGPNFPDLWARLATGRSLPRTAPPRVGVRFQWLEGDLLRARVERRGGLGRDMLGCVAGAPFATHSIWSAGDRGPFWDHMRFLAGLAVRKLARRGRDGGRAAPAGTGPSPGNAPGARAQAG
ncbi:MAG: ATP-grasp domain-containing protein [Actinomycetota bacterium]|nr:ATP-grasp domain-containing protein [Actinomycetota bacterium]